MPRRRHLLTAAVLALASLTTACHAPAVGRLGIVPVAARASLVVRVAAPTAGYRVAYLRERDWRRAEVTLSQNGNPIATASADATTDPTSGARSATITLDALSIGSGYAVTLKLYGATPEGPEALLATLAQPSLTLDAGTNNLPMTLGSDGKLQPAVATAQAVTGAQVDSWPLAGSPSGTWIEDPGPMVRLPDGNWVIADWSHHTICLIAAGGRLLRRLTGTGTPGYLDGPAATAQINYVSGIERLPDGSIVFADSGNHRLRKLSSDYATVSTIAGTGTAGRVDGAAAAAQLNYPTGIHRAADGSLVWAELYSHTVRRLSADGTTVGTLAGTGVAGFADGAAQNAQFNAPWDMNLASDGAVIVADSSNHALRRLSPDYTTVTTIAGTGGAAGYVDGPAATSKLHTPWGVVEGADGTLYVTDAANFRIRALSPDYSTVSTVAGSGQEGASNGTSAATATFSWPWTIGIEAGGALIVGENGNAMGRRIPADRSTVEFFSPGTAGFADGAGADARFRWPSGLVVAADGAVIVVDQSNHRIRRVAPDGTTVSTIAGDGTSGFVEGAAATARFSWPAGVALAADGALLVTDSYNHRVRRISPDFQTVTTIAGDGTGAFLDGAAASAQFRYPNAIKAAPDGSFVISDSGNHRIRRLSADFQTVTTIAGDGNAGFADGAAGAARFNWPRDVAVSTDGRVWIADGNNHRVRLVSADGTTVSTAVGDGTAGFADGAAGTSRVNYPGGVAVRADGSLLISDASNNRIRRLSADGTTVSTVAGDGQGDYVDGVPGEARFDQPGSLVVAADGTVYVTVWNWIRRIRGL